MVKICHYSKKNILILEIQNLIVLMLVFKIVNLEKFPRFLDLTRILNIIIFAFLIILNLDKFNFQLLPLLAIILLLILIVFKINIWNILIIFKIKIKNIAILLKL